MIPPRRTISGRLVRQRSAAAAPSGNRRRGSVKGVSKVRKLLKRLPDDVNAEIVAVYKKQGPISVAYARVNAPGRRIGQAITFRVSEKTLKFRVGLIGKAINRKLFFARILEIGRKAQTVTVKRRKPTGGTTTYRLRVSPIAKGAFDFVFGRAARFTFASVRPELRQVYDRALRRAAQGSSD